MNAIFSLTCFAVLTPTVKVESTLRQVAPVPADGQPVRSPNQTRAVVLVHGFVAHLREASVFRPAFRPWQEPGSLLVKTLQTDADVFAFAYGQNVPVDLIPQFSRLGETIATLKKLGYREIVLVGHSAGGLVARQFVEDFPDSGVAKVIQICSPNGGTPSATVKLTTAQKAFLDSLTVEGRKKSLEARKGKRIPDKLDFICIMGRQTDTSDTDGVVPCLSQWTPDLWKQCIPVLPLTVSHHQSTRTATGADALLKLIRDKQPRWKSEQVDLFSKQLFMKPLP